MDFPQSRQWKKTPPLIQYYLWGQIPLFGDSVQALEIYRPV